MRKSILNGLVLSILTITILANSNQLSADHGREIRPRSWQQDATLNDVFFVDKLNGWAVGEQGLILRTINGGEDWISTEGAGLDLDDHRTFKQKLSQMRPISQTHELYPLTCSLKSVFFVNKDRGWIAGNYCKPFLGTSQSVLLTTSDGGKSWKQLKGNFLPQINRIFFQDVLGGWAIGRSGNLFKSGVFATASGGVNWSEQDVSPSRNWIDGELVPSGFVVVDDEGTLGRIVGNKFEHSVIFGNRPGKIAALRMTDPKRGWAVGTSGTVLKTLDGGMTWKRPKYFKDYDRFDQFDFSSIAIVGDRAWIAGNPGTYVVSFDASKGTDIQFHPTENSLPIERVYFPNKKHGWAVGSNGLILSTKDGGRNWKTQRNTHDRIAMMIATRQLKNLPFACLSYYANEKDKIANTVFLGQHYENEIELAANAVRRLGSSAGLRLHCEDLRQEDVSFDNAQCVKELVRTIRTLRPSVLVCNSDSSNAAFLANCRVAIELASKSDAYPLQIEQAGLTTWQVDRFMVRNDHANGEIRFDGNRYLPRSGKLLDDQIAISRGLVNVSPVFNTPENFTVESFTGTVSVRSNDVFYGLSQLGRYVPTRSVGMRMGNLNSIATAPLKQKEFERLLAMNHSTALEQAEVQEQIRNFATGQESREAGIWLMQLAEEFLNAGRLELAAYTMEQLVNRIGDHSFTPAALMWLSQYYSSDEAAANVIAEFQNNDQTNPNQLIDEEPLETDLDFASSSPVAAESNGIKQVVWEYEEPIQASDNAEEFTGNNGENAKNHGQVSEETVKSVRTWRTKLASNYLNRLKQSDVDFAQSLQVQFMEAMLVKKVPGDISNQNLLKKIKRTGNLKSEFVFASNRELNSRKKIKRTFMLPTSKSFLAKTRPTLDGNLDDELWQNATENGTSVFKTMTPAKTGEQPRTDVYWIAHDDEFLYVAARCNKLNTYYVETTPSQQRDTDLSSQDRIQLILDFDRDCQSVFKFEVDYRGWAAESCAGAVGWNPNWYVATNQDDRAWFVECAIPLDELTTEAFDEDTVAAFAIRRLDVSSIDLWSTEKDRKAVQSTSGIVAGLKIAPKQFELIRFESASENEPNLTQLK